MKELIKKILNEQDDSLPNLPVGYTWVNGKRVVLPIPSKDVFFKAVKHIVATNPGKVLDYDDTNTEDRAYEMDSILKLFGLSGNYDALTNKIFWAAYDNRDSLSMGTAKSFDDLELRPLKKYKVECEEYMVQHVSYYWEPIVNAYSEDDAANIVNTDEDGEYAYYEWEDEPGFDKEYGDSDSDGKEIREITELETLHENKILKEESSSGLVSGLKKILKKWKESRTENRWYDEIEDLIKKEKLNEERYTPIDKSTSDTNPGQLPATEVLRDNEWAFINKLLNDGINNYSTEISNIASEGYTTNYNNKVTSLAKIFGVDDKGHQPRLQMIMKFILDTIGLTVPGELKAEALSKLKNGKLYEWGEYYVEGHMFETTWVRSAVNGHVPGFGPDHAAYKFAEDVHEYDPEISVDESYTDYEADSETEEVVVTSAEDINTGKNYTGRVSWEKGYSAGGTLHE